jgi:integrase
MTVQIDVSAISVPGQGSATSDAFGPAAHAFTLNVGCGPNGTADLALAIAVMGVGMTAGTSSGMSCSWNGVAMTLVGTSSDQTGDLGLFGLLNPAQGAKNLTLSWTGANQLLVAGASYVGVNQTSIAAAFKNFAKAHGAGSPNSIGVTTSAGEHLDHWLNDIAKPNTRPNTWDRYEQVVRLHLKPRIGGVPLRKLTVAGVAKMWADMSRENISSGNVKKCSEVLASALECAGAEHKIPVAPTANAAKPKVIRGEVEVFSDDEVRAILATSRSDPFAALYELAIGTGARQGELLALERDDFDTEVGTVKISKMLDQRDEGKFVLQPPKSKSGLRTVHLPGFALDAVKAHLKGRKPGPVFTTRTGNYISKSNFVRSYWKPLVEKAKVKYRKFHTLRHTHASRLLADGSGRRRWRSAWAIGSKP